MSDLNFQNLFGDSSIDFECPKCKHTFAITLNQVGTIITCPHCNSEIALEKDDSFDDSVNSVNDSLAEFSKLFD